MNTKANERMNGNRMNEYESSSSLTTQTLHGIPLNLPHNISPAGQKA